VSARRIVLVSALLGLFFVDVGQFDVDDVS